MGLFLYTHSEGDLVVTEALSQAQKGIGMCQPSAKFCLGDGHIKAPRRHCGAQAG